MKQVEKISSDAFSFEKLANSIINVQKTLMSQAVHAVNLFMTSRNWIVGLYIVEYEQHGSDRAQYGDALLKRLSKRINMKGFGERRLYEFRQMYLVYPNLGGEIVCYLHHNNCDEILRLPTAILITRCRWAKYCGCRPQFLRMMLRYCKHRQINSLTTFQQRI